MVWKEELLFFTSSLFCSSIRFILKVESVLLFTFVRSPIQGRREGGTGGALVPHKSEKNKICL